MCWTCKIVCETKLCVSIYTRLCLVCTSTQSKSGRSKVNHFLENLKGHFETVVWNKIGIYMAHQRVEELQGYTDVDMSIFSQGHKRRHISTIFGVAAFFWKRVKSLKSESVWPNVCFQWTQMIHLSCWTAAGTIRSMRNAWGRLLMWNMLMSAGVFRRADLSVYQTFRILPQTLGPQLTTRRGQRMANSSSTEPIWPMALICCVRSVAGWQ